MSPDSSLAKIKSELLNRERQKRSGRINSASCLAPNASGFACRDASRISRTRSQSSGLTGATLIVEFMT